MCLCLCLCMCSGRPTVAFILLWDNNFPEMRKAVFLSLFSPCARVGLLRTLQSVRGN